MWLTAVGILFIPGSYTLKVLGQVSSLTSSLEVERSLDSCTLAVHRPLAYFRSANVKTFCKIHNKSSFIRALNRLFRLVLQYILRWLISLQMNYRRQNEIFGIGIYFQAFIYISTVIHLILVVVVKLNFYCWIKSLTHVWELPICPFIFQIDFLNSIPPIFW